MKTIDNLIEQSICHEWGHALMCYLQANDIRFVETIEIENTLEKVDGHTRYFDFDNKLSDEQKMFILIGGVTAETICGYSKVVIHRGTDAQELKKLLPPSEIPILKEKAIDMMFPYKSALEWLTKTTIELYAQSDDLTYFRIFKDDLSEMMKKAITIKPPKSSPREGNPKA